MKPREIMDRLLIDDNMGVDEALAALSAWIESKKKPEGAFEGDPTIVYWNAALDSLKEDLK